MKILEKYGKNSNNQYIKRCSDCKSLLVYDNEDLKFDLDFDEYIECPVCNNRIYIGMFKIKYKPEKHGCIKEERKIGF